MIRKKIKSKKAIAKALQRHRAEGKKISAISGGMDLLHAGHVFSLIEASKKGDILVVLLNSDSSIRLYKGPNRPIINEADRAMTVAALACVDYVVLFDEINPKKILEVVKPDVYCVSPEWGKNAVERTLVEKNNGSLHVIPRDGGPSTTEILRRVHEVSKKQDLKAIFLDRDGTINHNKNGYIYKKADFRFLPGVIQALKRLSRTEYLLFIVTNQSGIGRGMYTEKDLQRLHTWLKRECAWNNICIHEIYHCSHVPEDSCMCRKPQPGLLLQAAREHGINLSKSWIVGDSRADIEAGREVNLRTIQIGDENTLEKEVVHAHYAVKDLATAVRVILSQ